MRHSIISRRPQRVLVTGAGGFIGTRLCAELVGEGHDVVAMVHSAPQSHRALNAMGVTVVQHDLMSDASLAPLLVGSNAIIHLAALAHRRYQKSAWTELRAVNVESTVRLASEARRHGVTRLIYLSSIGVLGPYRGIPLNEDMVPCPADPYAVTKREAECRLWEATADGSLALTVIRPPLVYGPNAPGKFGRLLNWASRGWPLPLGGVSQNARSLIGLRNLTDFIQCVLNDSFSSHKTFHVADERPVSTAELLRLLGEASGKSPWLPAVHPGLLRASADFLGLRHYSEALLDSLVVDTSRAREVLDWVPPQSVEQGLYDAVSQHGSGVS